LPVALALASVSCETRSGPVAAAEAWKDEACACDNDACEARLRETASALAERASADLKTDAQRIEYGKAIAAGQSCLTRARWRR
jgi:hypothetical protein